MNFFVQQTRARTQTRRMVVLFGLAVLGIVLSVNLAAGLVFNQLGHEGENLLSWYELPRAYPQVFFWSTIVTLAIIGFSMLYKISTLRAGGSVVASQLGGKYVPPDTTNPAYRRLRNIVEEIAIASGVPVPEIFVLEEESAINAFAAGYTPADAAITVTRGCLEKLTRDELQGVIAHEFSHVLNGDMRLNIRLMGVLFGILVIGIIGQKILENSSRSRSEKTGGGIALIAFGLMIIGYVGVFFGRIIKASVSRSREYLADASAVQFTRQASGIAGALKKIGGLASGSKLNKGGEEVAHMLFGDGVGYSRFFATHPPLIERIKVLEPRFNPQELEEISRAWSDPIPTDNIDADDVSIAGLAPQSVKSKTTSKPIKPTPSISAVSTAEAKIHVPATNLAKQVGTHSKNDVTAAAELSRSIPEKLRVAAYMQEHAASLVFALVMQESENELRENQLALIERHQSLSIRKTIEGFFDDLSSLHPMQYLPLAALAFPALRRTSRPMLQQFLGTLNALIHVDSQMSLREYCLAKLVSTQVVDALDPSRSTVMGRTKLPGAAAELGIVFSLLAHYGHNEESKAQQAYQLGINELLPQQFPPYQPPSLRWTESLDRALPALNLLTPAGKELLINALAKTVAADGAVTIGEAELLRTLCAILHCPLPPLLDNIG